MIALMLPEPVLGTSTKMHLYWCEIILTSTLFYEPNGLRNEPPSVGTEIYLRKFAPQPAGRLSFAAIMPCCNVRQINFRGNRPSCAYCKLTGMAQAQCNQTGPTQTGTGPKRFGWSLCRNIRLTADRQCDCHA